MFTDSVVRGEEMGEKYRIAMLGHKRIPSREGGIEIVVEQLAAGMAERGYEVFCFNRGGHHVGGKAYDREQVSTYKNVHLQRVFTIDRKGLAAVTSSISASFRAAFGKYDIVHYHAEGTCVMLWLPKLFHKRCIVTIHGLDWQREKWKGGLGSIYIRLGEKCAVKYADEIIVLSKNVQNYFQTVYGRTTKYIPNGVSKPEWKSVKLLSERFHLEKDQYILYLGRIVPEKGLRYLIEAYKKTETDKKLVIAGGSSDSEKFMNELKNQAKNDPRIIFTDFVQGEILEELYSNAYLYTLPSDLEGMPLSLLEAMSYGNCCLVSDIPECAEVVGDKAVLFKHGDENDLKEKLEMLCNHSDLVMKYKKQASAYICERYDWNRMIEKTLELYQGF